MHTYIHTPIFAFLCLKECTKTDNIHCLWGGEPGAGGWGVRKNFHCISLSLYFWNFETYEYILSSKTNNF